MNKARVKAIAVLAVVFLLGGVAGAAGAHAFGQRRMAALLGDERGELRDQRRLHALSRKLDLTEAQRMAIAEAFRRQRDARRKAMDTMFERCGDDLRALRGNLEADINAVLDPEQRERFAKIAERHRKRFLHRKHRRGRGGHGSPSIAPVPR